MRVLTLAVLLFAAIASAWAAGPARADERSAVTIEPLPVPMTEGQQSVVLSARLLEDGEPLAGQPVAFYVLTTVFGERLMKVGDALSDSTGIASLLYRPTWEGDHTAVARFAGTPDLGPTESTFHFDALEVESPYEPAEFGLDPVRAWLPLAVGTVALAVVFVLGFAMTTTVVGIRAAAAAEPAPAPLPPWDSRVKQPAPLGRALAATLLLLVAGAYPAWRLLGDVNDPDEGSQVPGYVLDPGDAGPTPATGETISLPATLISHIETAIFDEGGAPAPGSLTVPMDVAITEGRVRMLDSARGRIATLTEENEMTTIYDGSQYNEASLKGARTMAAFGDKLYVPLPEHAGVLLLESSGKIETIIPIVAPPGNEPFTAGGIAITRTGEIWISDSANHRVILLNVNGEFERVIGTGSASEADDGFDTPGDLVIDGDGNLYVADTGNAVVKKFSPTGVFLGEFGDGWLESVGSVAVDTNRQLFVADGAARTVSVFEAGGGYIGSIAASDLSDPHRVALDGDTLYVVDRVAGLFVFQAPRPHSSEQ